jgi:DMSO/TMAO reductase YedYZ heme-binding membrane subunit
MRRPIQMRGFSLAGFLCVALAVLKLTSEVQWSWWRALLPFWAVLGHNLLYVIVGFAWLYFG